jgi:hypothetical protein
MLLLNMEPKASLDPALEDRTNKHAKRKVVLKQEKPTEQKGT